MGKEQVATAIGAFDAGDGANIVWSKRSDCCARSFAEDNDALIGDRIERITGREAVGSRENTEDRGYDYVYSRERKQDERGGKHARQAGKENALDSAQQEEEQANAVKYEEENEKGFR